VKKKILKKIENNETLAPGAAILSFHFFNITGCQILMSGSFAVTFDTKINFYVVGLYRWFSHLHKIVIKFQYYAYRVGVKRKQFMKSNFGYTKR